MSQSPRAHENAGSSELGRAYEAGWEVVHRLIREGRSWSGREKNCFFLNTGTPRFANTSALSGADFPDDGRAAARCDWDGDGKLDLWVANRTGPRLRFLHNETASDNSFVEFDLRGTRSNRDAIGAKVELVLAGESRKWIQSVRAGEGYLAQSTKLIHFGVPANAKIEKVLVRWPNGAREEFAGANVGARYRIVEGAGKLERWSPPSSTSKLAASTIETPKETEAAHILLAARPPLPVIDAFDLGGASKPLKAEGRPLLALLWATSCAPCQAELANLVAHKDEIEAADLDVIAVSLDDAPERQDAVSRLQKLDWPYGIAFGAPNLAEQLDLLQRTVLDRKRRLPLPASFLIDAQNRVACITKGAIEPAILLDDLHHLDGDDAAIRARATPFVGRWFDAPAKCDLIMLERDFREAGFDRSAHLFQQTQMTRLQSSKAKVYYDMGVVRADQAKFADAAQLFEQAVALEPSYFEARAALAFSLHKELRLDLAIAEYRRALHLSPEDVPTLFNLGLALAQNGERNAALSELGVLDALDPKTAAELAKKLGL